MTAPCSLLLVGLTALTGQPALAEGDEGYRMNDVRGSVFLPEGYTSTTWADWELKAKHSRGLIYSLWLTPFQVQIDEDHLNAWSAIYAGTLRDEGMAGVTVESQEISEIGGRTVGRVSLAFKIKDVGRGVAEVAIVATAGQMVHMRLVAASNNASRATRDLDQILGSLKLDSGPEEVSSREVVSDAGFKAELPAGWRPPLRQELEAVREITAKLGEKGLARDDCWVGIRPPVKGDPDVIFACKSHYYIGPLDEHSFEGVEAEVNQRFFGRADTSVPPAEAVTVGDRMGLLYRPPKTEQSLRLALAPYSGGMMMMWGIGADEAALDDAVRGVLPTVAFTGADGGKPIIGFDKTVLYYVKYRTGLVALGLCPLLAIGAALLAVVGAVTRRKREV